MCKMSLAIMSILMVVSFLWACPPPTNMEGVAFTSGEKLNLEKLMEMGVENVNYVKEGEPPNIGIKYISHYDSRAIVFIGNYGMSYQEGIRLNCMGIIFVGPIPANMDFSRLERDFFDFSKAVKAELEWLANNGILEISKDKIDEIYLALSEAVNGGVQYWTHAKNTLGYNAWYEFDSINGVWAAEGVAAVRGVKGGCSVVYPGDGVPSEPLGVSAVKVRNFKVNQFPQKAVVQKLNGKGVKVFFDAYLKEDMILSLYNCKGAIVFKKKVSAGLSSLFVPHLKEGYYIAKISQKR